MNLGRAIGTPLLALCLAGSTAVAQDNPPAGFDTKAPQAFMMDAETGSVLFSRDPDKAIPPAALAKLMTMEVVFDALKSGRAKLDDVYTVSENAWRTGGAPSGGSTMFAALKSKLTLNDLIQAVIVQSANDGCIIIAEGMAGSEAKFAEMMNERARAIGLKTSVFKNSTGLPAEGQVVTLHELALLGRHIWQTYPEYYGLYAQPDFTWNKIFQRNRNPLLRLNIGADGMGTGYTEASGYAILASASKDGRRLFAALGGMASDAQRAEEARKMIEYGLDGFERTELFETGDVVGRGQVFGGLAGDVPLKTEAPVSVFIPIAQRDAVKVNVVYQGPIRAPIRIGDQVGRLRVTIAGTTAQDFPLVAAGDVPLGSLQSRAVDSLYELGFGWLRQAGITGG